MQNNKNILLATMISMVILLSWTWFYEKPKMEKREAAKQEMLKQQKLAAVESSASKKNEIVKSDVKNSKVEEKIIIATKGRDEVLNDTKNLRVKIESEQLHGSIYLKGARFDDLTLAKYFKEIDKKEEVVLFAPAESKERYFADFGFASSDASIDFPNAETIWKSNSQKLTPENPIILSWKNRQNVEFIIEISLDKNFMFFVKQKVKNLSGRDITVANYGRVNRVLNNLAKPNYILHEGFLGVFNGVLQEITYKNSIEDGAKKFDTSESTWLGITDKYWLSAIIADKNFNYQADFSHSKNNQNNIFNSEFLSQEFKVEKKSEIIFEHKLFAGAKKVKLLDQYSKDYNIKLFDRAIDFGWFYFLTKPFFFAIDFLYKFLGNFGLAILAMTVIIKLLLFPMANKSYAAIARMKKLQPQMNEIREKYKDDKMALNRAMMEMYKREKVNPASGCLPILLQIPIFFSLYKVIFVTLDMRQAPFYGWIKDLSMPDPTSIFNLFGLLPFEVGGILAIGIWPILMGITMILQQKLSPAVADPTQAKVLKFMPYILTVVLAAFPAGLVIYWTWSNLLSILQQFYITKIVYRDKK